MYNQCCDGVGIIARHLLIMSYKGLDRCLTIFSFVLQHLGTYNYVSLWNMGHGRLYHLTLLIDW
jgi:hypothetical protein